MGIGNRKGCAKVLVDIGINAILLLYTVIYSSSQNHLKHFFTNHVATIA